MCFFKKYILNFNEEIETKVSSMGLIQFHSYFESRPKNIQMVLNAKSTIDVFKAFSAFSKIWILEVNSGSKFKAGIANYSTSLN